MAAAETEKNLRTAAEWTIHKGSCFVLFAYDAARSVNLDEAERRLHEVTQRQTIPHKWRAPSYFDYQPPPLRVSQETEPVRVGKFHSRSTVDLVVYDFGAVAAVYSLPIDGSFTGAWRYSNG